LIRIRNTDAAYQAVVTHAEQLAGLDWHYVILDEGHKIRNPEAQVGGRVLRIRIRRDPHAFGPPGSGSFYHQAKLARKTLIPLSLKNDVNVPSKSNKQNNLEEKIFLLTS
jgi:hypothetical protein